MLLFGLLQTTTTTAAKAKSHIFISFDVTYIMTLSISFHPSVYESIWRKRERKKKYDIDRFISFYFYIVVVVVVVVVGECMYQISRQKVEQTHTHRQHRHSSNWQMVLFNIH